MRLLPFMITDSEFSSILLVCVAVDLSKQLVALFLSGYNFVACLQFGVLMHFKKQSKLLLVFKLIKSLLLS